MFRQTASSDVTQKTSSLKTKSSSSLELDRSEHIRPLFTAAPLRLRPPLAGVCD